MVVRPETVIRWHRKAFRGYWRWISKPAPGRPPIPKETKTLIGRMATENGWRARKIQAELSKLGIHLGLTTLSRCLPKVDAGGDPHERWMTFLRNHRDVIAGMDFFVVPTVRLTLLYVGFESTSRTTTRSASTPRSGTLRKAAPSKNSLRSEPR